MTIDATLHVKSPDLATVKNTYIAAKTRSQILVQPYLWPVRACGYSFLAGVARTVCR